MKNQKVYCIDTHPYVWYLSNSPKLSRAASAVLEEVESGKALLYIPIIVLAEIVFIAEKNSQAVKVVW